MGNGYEAFYCQIQMKLPSKVDLRSKMPPVIDQGEYGSSAACAIAASIEMTTCFPNLKKSSTENKEKLIRELVLNKSSRMNTDRLTDEHLKRAAQNRKLNYVSPFILKK